MLVPYFDGERNPNLPDATGTLHGLTNTTTREQLAIAAHDGVLCSLLNGVDALRRVGATVDGRGCSWSSDISSDIGAPDALRSIRAELTGQGDRHDIDQR